MTVPSLTPSPPPRPLLTRHSLGGSKTGHKYHNECLRELKEDRRARMKMKQTVNTQLRLQSLPRVGRGAAAIIVALTIFTSLGLARSSHAMPMLFTLTGVTFNDGATATGSFAFNPTTGNFGAFLITTTTSVSNTGSIYSSLAGTSTFYLASPDAFIFDNFSIDSHYLVFSFSGHITGPGVYALDLGVPNGPDSFLGSGEFVDAL